MAMHLRYIDQSYEGIIADLQQVTTLLLPMNTMSWALSAFPSMLILTTNTQICSQNTITDKYEG